MSWDSFWSAIAGGVFVLFGTWLAHYFENNRRNNEKQKKIKNLLSSIYTELNVFWNQYYPTMGKEIEKLSRSEGLTSFYPLSDTTLSVYYSNSNMIGNIEDSQLREAIVKTFGKISAFKATINYNNALLEKWEKAFFEVNKKSLSKVKNEIFERDLDLYGKVIKNDHYEVKKNVKDLLSRLKPYSMFF